VVRRPHLLGLREQGGGGDPVARQDLRHGREDHARARPDREGGRGPQQAEARDRAEVLPGLRPGGDGADRRHVAPRAQHAEGHGLRRLRQQAGRAVAGGGRRDHAQHGSGRREAQAQVRVPARRQGARHRRAVRQLPGLGGGHQPRARADEGLRTGFRAPDVGRARVLPGGATLVKKVQAVVKLQIPAGKANPSPPVGPALGQHGVNIMEFCKGFNAQTNNQEGLILPVVSKRYDAAAAKVDPAKPYSVEEAIGTLKGMPAAKFDESVDLSFRLGVDPKHADQMVRGAVVLPHGIGKTVRVAVFAKGEKEREAREAGADVIGAEDLVEKVQGGFMEFDTTIATPDPMGQGGRLGKVLGPRGLMPNPKLGTVTFDIGRAVREAKVGKVEFRVDKAGNIHTPIGKRSFTTEQLAANALALIEAIVRAKLAAAKGTYLRTLSVSATMSPAVRIDAQAVANLFKKATG